MKAAVIEALNAPFTIVESPLPTIAAGEALVRLKAAAYNHRDVWIQKGMYPGIKFPVFPGSDGAGIVESVGNDADAQWIGKEVVFNPSLNWGDSELIPSPAYKILGMPDAGTFAEYIKVPVSNLCEKPTHLSFEQAAALPLAGLTGWRALMTKGAMKAGDKVLVTGVGGGVALFVMQFAAAAGAEVWVTSGKDEKIQKAIELGAKGGINYKTEKWEKALVQQAGLFDVIIDSAGGDTFAKLIDVAKPGGRIAFYGGTLGTINGVIPGKVFFKQLTIMGSTMGNDAEFANMVAFVNEHTLIPVVDTVFSLEQAEEAARYMDSGQQFGKIVLSC
jgi:zinc-binding alcohol dehydrogenase/oxidoreductase